MSGSSRMRIFIEHPLNTFYMLAHNTTAQRATNWSGAEAILVGTLMLGVLLKMYRCPGASALFVLSALLLFLLYAVLNGRLLGTPTRKDQVPWLSVLTGSALAATVAGQTCLIMHWPLAQPILIAAAVGCLAVCMIGLTRLRSSGPLQFYRSAILLRASVWGAMAFTLAVLFR